GMDEIYPGYGAIGRKRAAAEEAYRIEASTCLDELASVQKDAEADLRATVEAVQGREFESNMAAEARNEFHRSFLEYLDQLAAAHDHLCHRYRQINSAVQDGKVPAYFQNEVARPACLVAPTLSPPPLP